MQQSRILALDGLRGVLALAIIAFHYSTERYADPSGYTMSWLFSTSFIAVDFFFVLSGFVIAMNYKKISNTKEFKVFILRRWIRLFPMLFVSVAAYIPLKIYAINTAFEFNSGDGSYQTLLLEFLDPLFFLNSFPVLGNDAGLNPVSWSISAEMFSYLVFGLIVLFLKERAFLTMRVIAIGLFIFFLWHGRLEETSNLGFLRGLMGFSFGVLAFDWSKKVKWNNLFVGIVLIFISAISLYQFDHTANNQFLMVMPIIFMIMVTYLSHAENRFTKLLEQKVPQYLGKISYSVYLNHYLVIWIVYFLFRRLLGLQYNALNVWVGFLLVMGFTVLYSSLTYRFVEIDISKWLKKRLLS